MKHTFFGGLFLLLLAVTVAIPLTVVAPQKASAGGLGCVGGLLGGAISGGVSTVTSVPVSDSANTTVDTSTSISTLGSCINDVILIPLARAATRKILQGMTASVIASINGSNGSGQPSYVQNMPQHLQRLGDTQALSFIGRIASQSNSPFAGAIASALTLNYAQGSSLAGFFAANQCTLTAAIAQGGLGLTPAQVNSFVSGNFAQGGWTTWFALTTQSQNNPYQLAANSRMQLNSQIQTAQTNRVQQLAQNSGFLSWCGTSVAQPAAGTTGASCDLPDGKKGILSAGGTCLENDSPVGLESGDPCTNPDGTAGTIQTPGSVLHDYTQKAVVDSGFDQLISATDLDNALGSIVSALSVQIIASAQGLYGASQSSSYNSPFASQLQNYTSSNTAAVTSATSLAQQKLAQVGTYTSGWNTIQTAANTASSSIAQLIRTCQAASATDPSQQGNPNFNPRGEIALAQSALAAEVSPLISEAANALTQIAQTQTLAIQVQNEAGTASGPTTSGTIANSSQLNADVQTLATLPPLPSDLTLIQQATTVTGQASSTPPGSLNVAGGSVIDQMRLISANVPNLMTTYCTATPINQSPFGF